MQGEVWVLNSKERLANFQGSLAEQWAKQHWLEIQVNTDPTRTGKQNSALQIYCRLVADALNDSGQERSVKTPAGEVLVPWNEHSIKEAYWRPLQIAITGEVSTTKAGRTKYADIYDVMNRHLGETRGVSVPWPVKREAG